MKKIYNNFIKTGEVPLNVLRDIAGKIIRSKELTKEELEMFTEKSSEIEKIISERKSMSDAFIKNMIDSYNLEEIQAQEFIGGKVFIDNKNRKLFAVKDGVIEKVSYVPITTSIDDALKILLQHFNEL